MRYLASFFGFLFFTLSCGNSVIKKERKGNVTKEIIKIDTIFEKLKMGADNFVRYLPLLAEKKVGIVTNQSGLLSDGTHVVDFLLLKSIDVKRIFSPEHGFRGNADAGEPIKDGKDSKTDLPIISLYGDNKKPKQDQLKGIDVMVFDLQDVGSRFYTYISSLHYVMEACAENNITLIVLDRPNPNGKIVDGPVLEKEFTSFVGMHPIPVLHGMTIGEYAKMINGEKWLKNNIHCELIVIPCLNYSRTMAYDLPAKPSPNLPNAQAVNLYASLCFFEGTNVSVGRGTEKQFQIYGSPFLPKRKFSFIPTPNIGAKNPMHKDALCYGEDLSSVYKIKQLELKWLLKAYNETFDKAKFFNSFFVKLAGTRKLQEQIKLGVSEKEIRNSWKEGLKKFKTMRASYLIYN
ncbi:DUF1343 domain-containing protein [uncultured Flavobacterium sp.]|uniref:exo-beta-N-acetylmuramidase NamZ family protein n=1 Tax=uncultured Flavobacterium sp. TaxID=165435 RepID=UPI0030CA53F7